MADFQGYSGHLRIYCWIWQQEGKDYTAVLWLPNAHKPHSHKLIIFFSWKPELKYYYPVIKTAGLYSFLLPSTSSSPESILPDSPSPNGPYTPGRAFYSAERFWQNHICWSCIFGLLIIIIICFEMEGTGKPTTFPGSCRLHQQGCPLFTCHLCKVKEPQSSNH